MTRSSPDSTFQQLNQPCSIHLVKETFDVHAKNSTHLAAVGGNEFDPGEH
jgi:hypothetical protein